MTEPLTPQPKTKPVLLSLLTLLSGIVIGVGATLIAVKQEPTEHRPNFTPRMLEHLMRELKLTDEQTAVVEPIIESHKKQLDELFAEVRPKISAIYDSMNDEIAKVLDDHQKQILEEKKKETQNYFERMKKRRQGRPGERDGRSGPDGQRRGRDGERRDGEQRDGTRRDGPRRGDADNEQRLRQRPENRPGDPNSMHFPPQGPLDGPLLEGPPPEQPDAEEVEN